MGTPKIIKQEFRCRNKILPVGTRSRTRPNPSSYKKYDSRFHDRKRMESGRIRRMKTNPVKFHDRKCEFRFRTRKFTNENEFNPEFEFLFFHDQITIEFLGTHSLCTIQKIFLRILYQEFQKILTINFYAHFSIYLTHKK